MNAESIIKKLGLIPLPGEGGYYAETFRGSHLYSQEALPPSYIGPRSAFTSIYYLLTAEDHSAMHKLPGDEIFHFYLGDPVEMLQLKPDGSSERIVLGTNLEVGMKPQVIVRGGVWQGSRLVPGGRFALLGTTMAPGFEFADYSPGNLESLSAAYPSERALIKALC